MHFVKNLSIDCIQSIKLYTINLSKTFAKVLAKVYNNH